MYPPARILRSQSTGQRDGDHAARGWAGSGSERGFWSWVGDVWWPYDSSATVETWPPNRVSGFRVDRDDDQPVLLETVDGSQPQQDDELRLWYSTVRTVQNLDSASVTTIPTDHESWLVLGAAGYAAFARATDLAETAGVSAVSTPNLAALGSRWLKEFRRTWTRCGVGWDRAGQAGAGVCWWVADRQVGYEAQQGGGLVGYGLCAQSEAAGDPWLLVR